MSSQLIKLQSYFSEDAISRWSQEIEKIPPLQGGIANIGEVKSHRDCYIRGVHFINNPKLYNSIASEILQIVDACMINFTTKIYRTLEIQHVTYNTGHFYRRHMDSSLKAEDRSRPTQRKISLIAMLSNPKDYTGGELIVNNEVMPNELGTVVIFSPFSWHEVKPITSGVRKSLVMWAIGPVYE